MTCSACGFENPRGVKFCGGCGAPLQLDCSACGFENPPGFRFCGGCGAPLAGTTLVKVSNLAPDLRASSASARSSVRHPSAYTPKHLAGRILQSRSAIEGERKQVTVLFADVKGSMELAEQLDPEAWHRILDRFFKILTEGVHRFEGTVNQYTGDGIMALFGAPIAHEDHAQRACYAALHLGEELRQYASELKREHGLQFAVRMGINSGAVIVGRIGDDLRMDYTAQGHTVGLAQRMEQLADPGKIYLSADTAKLVGAYFVLADLGTFTIKGIAEGVGVHELHGVGALRTRLDVSRARGLSRFVGRTKEMAILEAALARATDGQAQIVGLVADAGVGKSRMCWEFIQSCRAKGLSVYEAHGVAHGKAVPFLPVFEYLRAYFGIGENEAEQAVREKVAGKVLLLNPDLADTLPLLFDFLGVPDPERLVPRMDPEARQRALLDTMARLVKAETRRQPGVSVVEDLHWLDGGSEAFLASMVESIPGTRSLLILNFRPEYHARWMQKSYYQQIALAPLGPDAIVALLTDLLGNDPSIDGLPALIQERTAGNAFFVEEVVQALIEDGSLEGIRGAYRLEKPIASLTVPPSVQTVLAARIDRLPGREKEVLQTAAVIGKTFSEALLAAVVDLRAEDFGDALGELQTAEFIYQETLYPVVEYTFKHPLTQEVALSSQLQERRRRTHGAVARAIEATTPDMLDEQAALLAHHWEAAHEPLTAAEWHRRAAEWLGSNDLAQSATHWNRIRELLRDQTSSTGAARLCALACTKYLSMGWRLGLPEQETAAIYEEGRRWIDLCGDTALRAFLESSYGANFVLAGDVVRALDHALEFERIAKRADSAELRAIAVQGPIYSRYVQGDMVDAKRRLDELLRNTREHKEYGAQVTGFSLYVWGLWMRALIEVYTGNVVTAKEQHAEALRLARERGDVEIEGWLLATSMTLALIDGGLDGVVAHCRKSAELAERIGSPISQHKAYMLLGRALAATGAPEEAVTALERSLRIARDHRTGLEDEPYILAALAEAQLGRGYVHAARELAKQAINTAQARGTRINEMHARLAFCHVLASGEDSAETSDAIRTTLDALETLIRETGARNMQAFVHVERAGLAERAADGATQKCELQEARRLFHAMRAPRRVEKIRRRIVALP